MSLPHQMIDLVLCRLPVKPLLRFRCVSKGWCSLIDSDAFVKKHLETAIQCNSGGGLLINDDAGKIYLADFDSLDDGSSAIAEISNALKRIFSGAKFFGAANGLVCVAKEEMNEIVLFNPATRKARKLPSALPEFPRSFHTVETSICGFGYDHVNDDYKVVKIAECQIQFHGFMVIVYSLKANSWTRVWNVPSNVTFYLKWGVFASGALHWLGSKNPGHGLETIVGFDIGLERFKEIPFPPLNKKYITFNYRSLGPFGESLCILDNYRDFSMDMWLMKEYGAENPWYRAFTFKQPGLLNFLGPRPLALSKSRKSVLLEMDHEKLMWYDPKRKTFKKVRIRGIPNSFYTYLYTESLLQLAEDKPHEKPSQDKQPKKQQKKRDVFLSRGFNLKL